MSDTQSPAGVEHASDAFLVCRQLHGTGAVGKYRELVSGRPGLGALLGYEAVTLLASGVPGALALFLRRLLYARLLGTSGAKPIFGCDVVLRHPHKIHLGDEVIIDDNVWLGAGVKVLDGVSIGADTVVGAGAVVAGDLPARSVAAGVPARVARER